MQRANSMKKTLMLGKTEGRRRGQQRASLTQGTWVWANSRRRWRAEKTGVLQFKALQRVRHSLATEPPPPSSTKWILESTTYGKGLICDIFKLFIFGWAESALLRAGVLEVWLALRVRASHCGGFSSPAALALDLGLSSCGAPFSDSSACGIFLDHGLNLSCSLHWQVDSYPLHHQERPSSVIFDAVAQYMGLLLITFLHASTLTNPL